MSGHPKPRLSLTMGSKGSSGRSSSAGNPPPASATTPKIKLKLNIGGSKASTPIASTPIDISQPPSLQGTSPSAVKKVPRARKPSAKLAAANANANGKRDHPYDTDDDTISRPAKKPEKKIKLSLKSKTPTTPVAVKLKVKGKAPKRPYGEGYDSEASDQEKDPSIEEQFIIRFDDKMLSATGIDCSDDCAYIHEMIRDKKIGGAGVDISLMFHHEDGRRATVTVRKNTYAATLVDMPTVTESMKSFDRRTWMKTADVSQMLLVFARINKVDEIKKIDLPKVIDNRTYEFPHGLTPPMRFARHRRFRHRTRRNDIEEVEREVEALMKRDEDAAKSTFEWFDPEAPSRDASHAITEDIDENADAEGEIDDSFIDGSAVQDQNMLDVDGDGDIDGDGEEVDLEGELENAFLGVEEAATPATEAATPVIEAEASTPLAGDENEADSDDDSGDEEDEDDGQEELNDEARAKQAFVAEQREDIAEMEKHIEGLLSQLRNMKNPILKKRLETSVQNAKGELVLKKAKIEGLDDES